MAGFSYEVRLSRLGLYAQISNNKGCAHDFTGQMPWRDVKSKRSHSKLKPKEKSAFSLWVMNHWISLPKSAVKVEPPSTLDTKGNKRYWVHTGKGWKNKWPIVTYYSYGLLYWFFFNKKLIWNEQGSSCARPSLQFQYPHWGPAFYQINCFENRAQQRPMLVKTLVTGSSKTFIYQLKTVKSAL